jgi:excisionase family DNA binding protein
MNENSLPQRKTLSVGEAAEALGIGRTLAYEAVRRGEIPTIRIGRRLLVPRGGLDQLLGSEATVEVPSPAGATGECTRAQDHEPAVALSATRKYEAI